MNSDKILVVSSVAAGMIATRPRSIAEIGRGEALHRGIVVSPGMKAQMEQLEREADPRYYAPVTMNVSRRDDGRPLQREMTRRFPTMTRRERRAMLRDVGRGPGKLI
jgi:hypothetical protein